MVAQSEDITPVLKKLNLKAIVFSLAQTWDSIEPRLIQKSWKNYEKGESEQEYES